MKQTYNFPFFGAGAATYFEWVEVIVIFKKNPTEEQKKAIEKSVPFPIDGCHWEDNTLTASSDQFAHVAIAQTYKTKDGLDPENQENWDEGDEGRWFFAASSQVEEFNNDIERWLNQIHETLPILLVCRREDVESGGTNFSNWHKWSLDQIEIIQPYFNDVIANFDYKSTKSHVFHNIFYMVNDDSKFDAKCIKYMFPGEIEFEAFEKGDVEPLKSISNNNYAERTIARFIRNLKEKPSEKITKFADVFLSFEPKISKKTFEKLNELLFTYVNVNSDIFRKIAEKITNENFVDRFASSPYQLTSNQKYQEAIEVCEKMLMVSIDPKIRTGFYTNILWLFQKDNTGLPINRTKNELALKKSIPKGVEHPAIFFNACCIYVEMEEYDAAYKMVEKAISHHYDKDFMLREIKTDKMFKAFREKTDILKLLENVESVSKKDSIPRFISESYAYTQFNIHSIYNNGYATNFSNIILFDGSISIKGEFNDLYKLLINKKDEAESEVLVVVNGNLKAKSIGTYKNVYLLVMGKINCPNISLKEVIEKEKTDFSFVVDKPKKFNE